MRRHDGRMKAAPRILSFTGARAAFLLCLPLIVFSSCGFFARPPALPRRAAIDSTGDSSDDKFTLLVENADIIYFPSELVGPARKSEAPWKLLEALQQTGGRFALGWDLIGGGEQSILREASKRGAHFIALRAESETALPREEFAAERIAGYFREHRDEKLLVFLHRRQLGNNRGVPYFVAQKVKARQLVLDSREHPENSRLMADGRSWPRQIPILRRFQIVNSSPSAGSDQL